LHSLKSEWRLDPPATANDDCPGARAWGLAWRAAAAVVVALNVALSAANAQNALRYNRCTSTMSGVEATTFQLLYPFSGRLPE
jgi:hypothetical protein